MTDEINTTRSERLLALLVLHNMAEASQTDKSVQLDKAGFSAAEIADLLGTSPQTVNQNLYMARKAKKGGRKAPTKKPAAKKAAKKTTKNGR